jgi:hypothetical protein
MKFRTCTTKMAMCETTAVGSIALWVVLAVGAAPGGDDPPSGPAGASGPVAPVEFNRDIRPLLSDRCYPCHGPDAAKRKADLRLDQESSAKAARDGRPAIVPGNRESSELVRRITARDDDERMPPVKSGKSLAPAEIELISRWVAQGAAWLPHWSFMPPRRPLNGIARSWEGKAPAEPDGNGARLEARPLVIVRHGSTRGSFSTKSRNGH